MYRHLKVLKPGPCDRAFCCALRLLVYSFDVRHLDTTFHRESGRNFHKVDVALDQNIPQSGIVADHRDGRPRAIELLAYLDIDGRGQSMQLRVYLTLSHFRKLGIGAKGAFHP